MPQEHNCRLSIVGTLIHEMSEPNNYFENSLNEKVMLGSGLWFMIYSDGVGRLLCPPLYNPKRKEFRSYF